MPVSGWNGGNMVEPNANLPRFKVWKVTSKDGSSTSGTILLEVLDCIFYQLTQLASLYICPCSISTKLLVKVLFLWTKWILVFSTQPDGHLWKL
jgi:hypothetical protein